VDIILDTNTILEDPQFQGYKFRELFAYLRRTNSRLVIPSTVREEAKARFRDRLSAKLKRAREVLKDLGQLSGEDHSDLLTVDLEQSVADLDARLVQPSSGIRPTVFPLLAEIDFEEVVHRGITRKKPASSEGEELRDVVVWLHVKRYAAAQGTAVGFITRDGAFRSGDTDALAPELSAELVDANLSIAFHLDIAGFITSHALKRDAITEAWLSPFIPISVLRTVASPMLAPKFGYWGTVESTEIDSLKFDKGTQYEVDSSSSYVEATYTGTAVLRVRPARSIFSIGGSAAAPPFQGYGPVWPSAYSFLAGNYGHPFYPLQGNATPYKTLTGFGAASFESDLSDFGSHSVVADPTVENLETHKCNFVIEVSGRLEGGKVTDAQIDDLKITDMD
jgi:hypothetical protein